MQQAVRRLRPRAGAHEAAAEAARRANQRDVESDESEEGEEEAELPPPPPPKPRVVLATAQGKRQKAAPEWRLNGVRRI